jgi:hypothetical protein
MNRRRGPLFGISGFFKGPAAVLRPRPRSCPRVSDSGFLPFRPVLYLAPMKVRKTTLPEEERRKQEAWLALTGPERLEIHGKMIERIYGKREPPDLRGMKVRKYRRIEDNAD